MHNCAQLSRVIVPRALGMSDAPRVHTQLAPPYMGISVDQAAQMVRINCADGTKTPPAAAAAARAE